MRATPFRSFAAGLVVVSALAIGACGDELGPTPPVLPGPVPAGTWYLNTANGLDLPAEIARRFIGVVDEQTVLDSARLQVNNDGTWSQRYWTRVLHIGVLDRAELVIDEGTWATAGTTNTFVSTLRPRTFTIVASTTTRLTSDEPMVFFPNATNVTGVYQTTPPVP